MNTQRDIHFVSYASSIAGPGPGCGDGPIFLQQSPILADLSKAGLNLHWQLTTTPIPTDPSKLASVIRQCTELADEVTELVQDKKFFISLGGDHSCAIGTWSGVKHALHGPLGFIWIDAHMDSHTPQTTQTGNIHGMPLACLLGYGDPNLTNLATMAPKLKPENICLIGIRSYEAEEAELLKKLNVRIIGMDEIKQRGLADVLAEAIKIATAGTAAYGLSIDIDSIDPADAPGTDVAEPNGLSGEELCQAIRVVAGDRRLIGAEIAEFDPSRDQDHKTEKLIARLINAITLGY